MNKKILNQAVALAQKLKHVFVATANAKGLPHMAAAGQFALTPEGRVAVAAWFCPMTVANLQENRRVSLVIWDPKADIGYQLLGETEKIEEIAMMDGYAPGVTSQPPLPQVERQLVVRVDQIIDFKHAPHSDVEE
jgi:predicted pyridoxine 5'-phosphate oxidase superfamily flavin-nucleotide-binding protein